jgi:hypothetical protein
MSGPDGQEIKEAQDLPNASRRRRRWRMVSVLAAVLAMVLLGAWLARERIAHKVINDRLENLGLPATYKIQKIGATREILTDIVIGDPAHPDFTVERAEVGIVPTFGLPTIGRITLFRPRLYGRIAQGKISFGSLDKVLFANKGGPKGLPDLDLTLIGGRARIDSAAGPLGLSAEGAGNLRGGFAGTLAAIAPALNLGACNLQRLSAYGQITVSAAAPQFDGPVRLQALDCPKSRLTLRDANLQLIAKLGPAFDAADGSYALASSTLGFKGNQLASASGSGNLSWAKGDLTVAYKLKGQGLAAGGIKADAVALEGMARSHDRMASFSSEGALGASGLSPGHALEVTLASLEKSGAGTLIATLASQLRSALARETSRSSLAATFQLRQSGQLTNLTLPGALWRGGSGARLAALSHVAVTLGGQGGMLLAGNLVTDGPGLPHIEGRFERRGGGGGGALASLVMAPYRAGDSMVALPEFKLVQLPTGALGFAGRALVTGAVPGGRVDNLALPIEGNWSSGVGLAVLRRCTPLSFDRFKIANLMLIGQSLTVCPGPDGAILRSDARGTRVSAGTAGLSLTGTLGSTAIRLRSKAVGMAWPGALVARSIDVSVGPKNFPTTLKIALLNATLGTSITGKFAGTELKLNAVPIDVLDAAGNWRFANKEFTVQGASLTVKDRLKDARFYPLVARDATLSLRSTTFKANALLREPKSDRLVTEARIVHDLDTASGHADLLVPGILFDRGLQPDTLTYLSQGVIALAKGTVYGQGRIDWNGSGVVSTGDFATDNLDFAAQFGPVKGARGTVHFDDLLALVTAPNQTLHVASINPGIEVNDGDVSYQLEPGHLLVVNGAKWPFIDGSLQLLPTRFVLGGADVRHFTIKVNALNLAKFVQRIGLSNISASGMFDGELPLVFDQNGGRIENGILVSRAPGGNLSYIGELTYKDLSPMGNFAFQALRSLNFKHMEIGLQGRLDGEIVTKLRIDGVSQGQGAKRNFITQRFAQLPIRFNINIRGPFHQLITSFKSLYDPTYVKDPRSLGLIGPASPPPGEPQPVPVPSAKPPEIVPAGAPPPQKNDDIQHSDSRTSP